MDNIYFPDHFDLSSLFHLKPADYLCENCKALFNIKRYPRKGIDESSYCPVCKVEYVPVLEDQLIEGFKGWEFDEHLKCRNLHIAFTEQELVPHIKNLHFIAQKIKQEDITPLCGLFNLLLAAKKFIHITSYGASHLLIGALKTVAQKVDVRCVISGLEYENTIEEFTVYTSDAPRLKTKIYDRNTHHLDTPHQKVIIIDGLIGFKGSTNLTLSGWRKAEKNLDMLEVITDLKEVVEVNNRYFSPLWANPEITEIKMDGLPF